LTQFVYSLPVERCRSCSELPSRISAEVIYRDKTEVNFRKCHWCPLTGGLGFNIDRVHEDTHPLISCTVSVDGATGFPSCLYLNTLRAGLYTIVRIHTADNQVRMSIEIAVRGKRSRMFPETGRQHVGQKT